MNTKAAHRWSAVLAEAEQSPLSKQDFAHSRGLNLNTLNWWKWRLQEKSKKSAFVEVFVEESQQEPTGLTVRLPEIGLHIYVTQATDIALLRQVVEALC